MLKTSAKSKFIAFPLISIMLSVTIFFACSNKEEAKPQIVGCSSVKYNGTTWPVTGCSTGASSFRTEITMNGKKACFQVTCNRSGCVETITVCSGQELSPLAPSE